jgi:hypothetical protein
MTEVRAEMQTARARDPRLSAHHSYSIRLLELLDLTLALGRGPRGPIRKVHFASSVAGSISAIADLRRVTPASKTSRSSFL